MAFPAQRKTIAYRHIAGRHMQNPLSSWPEKINATHTAHRLDVQSPCCTVRGRWRITMGGGRLKPGPAYPFAALTGAPGRGVEGANEHFLKQPPQGQYEAH